MEKINYSPEATEDCLYHHGILGQKWGDRNGPPYPLDKKNYSGIERILNGFGLSRKNYTNSDGNLTDLGKEKLETKFSLDQYQNSNKKDKQFYDECREKIKETLYSKSFKEKYADLISDVTNASKNSDEAYFKLRDNPNFYNYVEKIFKDEYNWNLGGLNDMEFVEAADSYIDEYYNSTKNKSEKKTYSEWNASIDKHLNGISEISRKAANETFNTEFDTGTMASGLASTSVYKILPYT